MTIERMVGSVRRMRMRMWLAGAVLLVLVVGITLWVLLAADRDGSQPSAPDTATAVPATTGPSPTSEPSPSPAADERSPIACIPGETGLVFTGTTASDAFDGSPESPRPFCDTNWDIAVSSRAIDTYHELEPMLASHGEMCEGPPEVHQHTGSYEQAVFSCRDHVMTSIMATDYGVIYLTPAAMVDFSGGEAVISFDVSTFRASGRDWIDLWVTPWDNNLQLPLEDYLPDLQGEPRRAIHVKMDGPRGDTHFKVYVVDEFGREELPLEWGPLEQTVSAPESQRDTFELHISRTHLKFGMPGYDRWFVDSSIEDLGWDTGVVQFGHHSYNPKKDSDSEGPGTWHWDNVSISPAIPFSITRGDFRYADRDGQVITFDRPAAAEAHLRFSAVGAIELSFDGGQTWSAAERQAEEGRHPEHFSSYWTPIPEGATSVLVRGGPDDWFNLWFAKDFAIWSKD